MDDFKVTDMDIQALVDKELGPIREKIVLDAIQRNPDLMQRYSAYIHQKDLLKRWWKDN